MTRFSPVAVMCRRWTSLSLCRATVFLFSVVSALAKRHAVYWNSTNARLTGGDLSIQVNLNDYLDIYCPHYPPSYSSSSSSPEDGEAPPPAEMLALYLVAEAGFQGCAETRGAIKRWECNTPHAPFGPVRFSEKVQRFTPFSLGFEFLPGHHYYYSSLPTDEGPPLPCMKLRVTVCCETSESTAGSKQEQGTPAPRSGVGSPRPASVLLLFLLPLFLYSVYLTSLHSALTS